MKEALMVYSRPVAKDLLKKMYLIVLHKHEPDGMYRRSSSGYDTILDSTLPQHFGLDRLTAQEMGDAKRAITELEQDDYIRQDPSQSSEVFKVLTDRGRTLLEKTINEMVIPTIEIDKLLTRDDLKLRVRDDYQSGDYDTAIFKAFKLVEEVVRTKASLPATAIGADLMSTAFKPKGGILKHPAAATEGELEGFHVLMRGAIMWFKNPSSHRTVAYSNPETVAQALGFANMLLDLIDEC
jgi:uncharacterized protein (TIGR02391 family)